MKHIKELTELDSVKANDLLTTLNIDRNTIDTRGLWTIKKLISYKYYIDIYTRIIAKHFDNYYYFDLFSGSGLVSISIGNNTDITVFGSALLGVLQPRRKFTKYIFVEKEKGKADTLDTLLQHIKNNIMPSLDYIVINDDMNNYNVYANYLPNPYDKYSHALVVIDPEGMEPKWDTVKEILSYKCDVLITFMSMGIQRVLGRAEDSEGDRKTLENFSGLPYQSIQNVNIDKFEELYIQQIKNQGKQAYRTIDISARNFDYDIIITTRLTREGNPWLKHAEYLQQRLEISDTYLKNIIMQLRGILSDLDRYSR